MLQQVEIDTKNFLGNFPESCEIHGINITGNIDWFGAARDDSLWTLILPRTKLGPDQQHYFELENVENRVYTHARVTIYPDGGLKRVRIVGRRAEEIFTTAGSENKMATKAVSRGSSDFVTIPVAPLSADAYKSYGQVIQAFDAAAPGGIKVTPANGGTAQKFHKLSPLISSYPSGAGATSGISVYRCQPLQDIQEDSTPLTVLERHPYTSQAFIPMGSPGSIKTGESYLVVVAHNGANDQPDMSTLRAFLATSAQGISYNPGVWRK